MKIEGSIRLGSRDWHKLLEEWYQQSPGRGLECCNEDHRDAGKRERQPVRPYVLEQSFEILHLPRLERKSKYSVRVASMSKRPNVCNLAT